MKRLNRDGAPVLGALSSPRRLTVAEVVADPAIVVLDTRVDRREFMAAHLPGSLYAPATSQFTAVTGAYLEPGQPVVLLAAPDALDDLTRQLARIGLDAIAGWVSIDDVEAWRDQGGAIASIPSVTFAAAGLPGPNSVWVDVRGADEFQTDHVPGAMHVAQSRLGIEHGRIPRGRPLTVHCATGGRAALASAYLQRLGFEVRYIDDDFARWRHSGGVRHAT